MGDKYEFISIVFSRYGFRNHRDCHFRIKVTYPNGMKHTYYYEKLPDLRRLAVV